MLKKIIFPGLSQKFILTIGYGWRKFEPAALIEIKFLLVLAFFSFQELLQ